MKEDELPNFLHGFSLPFSILNFGSQTIENPKIASAIACRTTTTARAAPPEE
ncbi:MULTISPECIES: hypothetical protein [unclassified Paraburkholderia]|uniref:hypothetical protein n=1 Tax=unclassified Paraburkholderia TaxID=2615204 RepID=UPI0014170544|nr:MULTISPECIES: hypothetical protein [unclassified Paraburkholderia]